MTTKEDLANGIHCKGKGMNCPECKDSQTCEESTDKVVLDKFTINFYKNITREQIIMALGHTQTREIEASNRAYRLKKQQDYLVEWLENEIKQAEISAENQKNEYFKNLFLGQKVAYERVLRQITHLKLANEKPAR